MPIDFTCTGAGNRHVLTCTTGGPLLVINDGKPRDIQPATCVYQKADGEHSDRLYFANAYLRFPFDHVDFALLTEHLVD